MSVEQELVVVGGGGHGRETIEMLLAADRPFLGVVDDDLPHPDRLAALGAAHLGGLDQLAVLDGAGRRCGHVVAIGDPVARRRVAERCAPDSDPADAVVHPTATIGHEVQLGPGTIVSAAAVLTTNVRIGRHVQINVGTVVSHDSVVDDYATLSPGVLVNGDVHIGEGAFLGTGAIIVRGNVVGAGARVGAGAVVVSDVAPGTTVVGVPARPVGGATNP